MLINQTPGKWVSINSQILLKNNLFLLIWEKKDLMLNLFQKKKSMLDLLDKSIGEQEELLLLLKIKDNVDHVGLLLPLLLINLIKFKTDIKQLIST
jgi:hypothetical protein